MSAVTIEGESRLEVRLPHTANVIKESIFGLVRKQFDLLPLRDGSGNLAPIPRALQTLKRIGRICIKGRDVDVNEVTYGNTVDLPDIRQGIFQVVSPLTIAAAHREGRETTDLLFPYSPIYKNGRIIGARGLARAVFRPGAQFEDPIDYGSLFHDIREVKNYGLAPVQLFDQPERRHNGMQPATGSDMSPSVFLPVPESESERFSLMYKEGGLNRELTAYLGGIPVYEPELKGVANVPPEPFDATLRIVADPRVPLTLGRDAFRYGVAITNMVARDANGQVTGGTSLSMISSQNLTEDVF